MPKIIAIEGLDGCGKRTQTEFLKFHLQKNNDVLTISLPNYESLSSGPLRLYLKGDLDCVPFVTPEAVVSFFAIDRLITFNNLIRNNKIKENTIIICDRFVGSNIIYQTAKLEEQKWNDFIDFILDFEHKKLNIPIPDVTILLDMDVKNSDQLINNRYKNTNLKKDIYENNLSFLEKCKKCSIFSAKKLNWKVVKCQDKNKNPLNKEEIFKKILTEIGELF